MDYPFKTLYVVNGIVIGEIIQYQSGGVATGPNGSTAYDFAADNQITIGWRCLIDENDDPPQIMWRAPA